MVAVPPTVSDVLRPVSLRRRLRVLSWATLAAVVVGLLGLADPVDDYLRMARNRLQPIAPSGRIVVVAIDNASIERIGAWPWSRRHHADLVDRLKAAGAERIFFDIFFPRPGVARDDAAFATSLRNAGNVTLAVGRSVDTITSVTTVAPPLPMFARHVGLVSVTTQYSALASIRRFPFSSIFGDRRLPHMAVAIARNTVHHGETFPLNYAIDVRRIPTISASAILSGKAAGQSLAGRTVIVANTSRYVGDQYYVPGLGLVSGGYLNAVGAETLLRGAPVEIGWIFGILAILPFSAISLSTASRLRARVAIAAILVLLLFVPAVLDRLLIYVDVGPAIVGACLIAGFGVRERRRARDRAIALTNHVSGLPNLTAMEADESHLAPAIVGVRIENFDEIRASLPPGCEGQLIDQIVARLRLVAGAAQIYHGGAGTFLWAADRDVVGPDEFDALYTLFRSPARIADRMIDLSAAFGIDNVAGRNVANRVGAALLAADEAAAEGLRWKAYDPARLAEAEWKLSLLSRLDAAIDSGEIWVAYQPQVDVATGAIVGAEALVRWSHPEKGAISPADFVLAAEQHDRIDKLTHFVLTDAIRAAAVYHARGVPFDMAVNLSARLLERPGLVDSVRAMLAAANLPPGRLTLEVTESAAMTSGRASIRVLEELGSLGINVSIDDYGTGFSTLEYFKLIPATEVKIDRGFVAAIDRSASDRVMVRSTIELAHSLGRTVVAEGVESEDILSELSKLGCDRAQGYLFGRPLTLAALFERTALDASRAA